MGVEAATILPGCQWQRCPRPQSIQPFEGVVEPDGGPPPTRQRSTWESTGASATKRDDVDALVLLENGVAGYQASSTLYDWAGGATDMLFFSLRRGSGTIGQPDSIFGAPIEEGDILVPPVAGGLNANPGIAAARKPERFPGLKYHLTTMVCQATGGPCSYTGLSMKDSHIALGITEKDWGFLEVDFKATLDKFGVPEAEQLELFAIVGSTKGDIVVVE